MEPKAIGIQDIAIFDPVAAYGILLGIPRVPISMNATGTFASFAPNQNPIEGDLDTTIATRTWIHRITYAVAQPNVWSGNIYKTTYDSELRKSPGVSVKVTVHSGPRYLVSPQYTPLENFVNLIEDAWPAGWPLFKQQSIKVDFLLTGVFPSTSPNMPPYVVTMSFIGWQFLDTTMDNVSPDQATMILRKAGFFVPDIPVRA